VSDLASLGYLTVSTGDIESGTDGMWGDGSFYGRRAGRSASKS